MPTYQYACTECGDQLEVVQKFSDSPLTVCPACEGRLRKVFSPVGIVFKGSGFYRTDSRSGNGSAAKETAGDSSSSADSKADSGSKSDSAKSDSKTTAKSDSKTSAKDSSSSSSASKASGASGSSRSSGSAGEKVA